MRYSLLSRFQGGSLGSLIGETRATQNSAGEGSGSRFEQAQDQNLSVWSQIAIETAEKLIQSGQLTSADWQQLSQPVHRRSTAGKRAADPDTGQINPTATSSEAALATLPVILFFHESPSLLVEQLQQAAAVWLHPSALPTELYVWGTAIALALRERLQPAQFVSQLLQSLKTVEPPLVQQLEEIQGFIDHGIGLSQIRSRYSPLLKAFYYFGFTPEDFRLSVERAAQSDEAPLTTALTGALAGVYNSLSGMPIGWRLGDRHPAISHSLQQSQRLFDTWSGVYTPEAISTTAAIASVLVMQKRSSLKIISQE